MATYYFDRNSTTAGFGTLTGAWDTTTASWTTSGAGTTTPVAYTFTSSDEAKFGNTGVAGTVGGTATIAAALTITLNKVTTQNIAALQIIAGTNATTSVLSFAGTTPTIDVQSAGHLTISSKISGSSGFTKSGSNILTLLSTNNDITGTITISAGTLILGATGQSGDTLPTVTDYNISATTATLRALSNTAYTFTEAITGSGSAIFQCSNASGITLEDGVLVGLTNSSATYGAGVFANAVSSRLNIKDFPSKLAFVLQGASPTGSIYYSKVAALTTSSTINLDTSLTASGTITANLYNDDTSSSSNNLVISGAIGRTGTGTVVFGLRGGNTGNNELSGIISNATGVINISKSDAGKWILSGNNTFTGTITVSAGELRLSGSNSTSAATTLSGGTLTIANQNAIQNSTITHQTAGTTLSFDPALTAVTFGGLSGTLVAGVTFDIPSGLNLSIGNNNAATTYANLITGSGTLTKVGSGQTTLTGSNTGFNGSLVSSGSSGTLLTGSFTAITDAIPAISSVTMNNGVVLTASTVSKTITYNITFNSPIPSDLYTGSSYFGSGGVSSGDTVLHTYTGTLSGTGVFGLWAPNASVAATRYVRTKSSSLPSTLGMVVNSWTQFRRATYEWGGGNYDVGTNVLLDALDSDVATSNDARGIFSIVHRGTTDTEFVLNNINKTSGTAVTFSSYLRLGSASDVGDIKVKGVISQSVASLGIDKQGPRKLTLSGANTYTFNTLLSDGELVIANANALQDSTFVNQTAGTTLTFDPSLSAATFGGLSGTLTAGAGFTIPSGFNLSIGNNNANTDYYNLLLGTGTLTKIGTGSQGFYDTSLSSFTGNIVLNSAFINFYGSSFGAMTVSQTSGSRTAGYANFRPTVTNGYSFPAGFTLSGTGLFAFLSTNVTSLTTGFTLPAGATAGLTGTSAGSAATSATTGLLSITETSVLAQRTNTIKLNDFPSVLTYEFVVNSASIAQTHNIYYIASGSYHTYPTRIDIINYSGSVGGAGAQTANLYANQSSGALVLSGGIRRYSTISYSVTLNLRGTNAEYNEIYGDITQTSGTLSIQKIDSGTWALSGTNTYTGTSTLTSGILNVRSAGALGSSTTGNVTLTAGTLEIQGGVNVNKSTPTFALNGSVIKNVISANTLTTGTATLGANTTFNIASDSLTFPGVISGISSYTLNKTGTGTLRLSSVTNTYAGPTTISQGILEFITVNDAGSASNSSLGKPAIAESNITVGADGSAGLSHIGTSAVSTNRNLIFSGATGTTLTLDSSGTGSASVTYSSGGTLSFSGAGTHTVLFSGTNSNTNTFGRTIADGGSGATSITKSGSNTWVLSAITATGTATCNAGTLNFDSFNVTTLSSLVTNAGLVSITNGYTISANTTMNGGKITAVLTGAKTLLVDSSSSEVYPSTLQPDSPNGNNSLTGAITVSGCIDLITPEVLTPSTTGTARVLGTTNTVTVASGGIIRTKYSATSNQNGSARYYNLVLQNNSKIKIGLAA